MAIRVVEGVPGSGKTFYVVHHLLNNYYRWSEVTDWWEPREESLVVLTNIDGFKVGGSLTEAIEKAGGLKKFFNYDNMRKWLSRGKDAEGRDLGDKKLVIVVDEAQRLFDRKLWDKDVFFWFQYHRHLGIDIYLVTQDTETLAKELRALSEYEVKAVPRTLSFFGEFRYKFHSGGECWKTKSLKRDQRIFAVYQSMTQGEVEAVGSAPMRYFKMLAVLLVFMIASGWWGVSWWRAKLLPGGAMVGVKSASAADRGGPIADEGGQSGARNLVAGPGTEVLEKVGVAARGPVVADTGGAGVVGVQSGGVASWRPIGYRKVTGYCVEGCVPVLVSVVDVDTGEGQVLTDEEFIVVARRPAHVGLVGNAVMFHRWGLSDELEDEKVKPGKIGSVAARQSGSQAATIK